MTPQDIVKEFEVFVLSSSHIENRHWKHPLFREASAKLISQKLITSHITRLKKMKEKIESDDFRHKDFGSLNDFEDGYNTRIFDDITLIDKEIKDWQELLG